MPYYDDVIVFELDLVAPPDFKPLSVEALRSFLTSRLTFPEGFSFSPQLGAFLK